MNYKDYQNSRDLAWRLLLDMQIRELPISTVSVCRQLGVPVKLYNALDGEDGYTAYVGDGPVIFVRAGVYAPRQRFTTAHELGHILAGHVGKHSLVNREPSSADNPIEQEANVFASRLLAPACVLWGCGVKTAEDIQQLCQISRQASEYRMARMQVLYERDRFLTSPLERAVYEQFDAYIESHKISPRNPAEAQSSCGVPPSVRR